MSKPTAEKTLAERLRERAAAFNDAGLRYGVADLLNEAADALEPSEPSSATFGVIVTPYTPRERVDYSDPENVKAFWEQARREATEEREQGGPFRWEYAVEEESDIPGVEGKVMRKYLSNAIYTDGTVPTHKRIVGRTEWEEI